MAADPKRCGSCSGTGEREVLRRVPVSRGCVPIRERCAECKGTGWAKPTMICLRVLDDHAMTEEEFERLLARLRQEWQ